MTKRIEPPTEEQYRKALISEALSYSPQIRPCKKCEWPVISGFCCNYCGDSSPGTTFEQDAEWERDVIKR